jgi:hypothetical protein
VLSGFVRLVAHTPELQAYTASKLYTALCSDISQESLTLAATWIIGEYSEVLLEEGIMEEDQKKLVSRDTTCPKIHSSEMVSLTSDIGQRPSRTPYIHS